MQRLVRDLSTQLLGQVVTEPTIDAEVLRMEYEPHAGQLSWWESLALDNAACAGSMSGKTALESHLILRDIQRCAPLIYYFGECRYIYAGPTLTLMAKQALGYFRDLFEDELQLGRMYEGTRPSFVFSEDGCQRLLGFIPRRAVVHIAYAKESSNLESMRAVGAMGDEAGQPEFKEKSMKAIRRRLTIARGFNRPGPAREAMWDAWEAAGGKRHDFLFGRRHVGTTPYERNWFKQQVYDKALTPKAYAREERIAEKQGRSMEGNWMLHNWPVWLTGVTTELYERSRIDNGKSDSLTPDEFVMFCEGRYAKPIGAILKGWH